ncbi:MAG: DUF429 domain-containing protein [bacterium]|nr:DUF429 domain-containing protein [bacterium]
MRCHGYRLTIWLAGTVSRVHGEPAQHPNLRVPRMGIEDRSGDGRVFETYPAAALHQWGFRSTGYKTKKHVDVLQDLFTELCERAPWLKVTSADHRHLLATNDDAFDAIIAAMIARAAVLGLVVQPTDEEKARARTEGWIAIPEEGSFNHLTG